MMSTRILARLLTLFATFSLLFVSVPAIAATFSVTAKDCDTSPGGYQWAIEQANATPGRDTISIDIAEFSVDSCDHPDAASGLPIAITESVDILGNGNSVAGNVKWVDSSGQVNPTGKCPRSYSGGVWIDFGGSLLDIGVRDTDSSGIDVTIKDLKTDRLLTVGFVRRNATLTIEGSELNNSLSLLGGCADPLISVEDGADLTLKQTKIIGSSVPADAIPSPQFPLSIGVIVGSGGDLIMDDVDFLDTVGRPAAAIEWAGGTVKIVNSRFVGSHGLLLYGTATQFVNSAFQTRFGVGSFSENIILQNNAVLKTEASTFFWGSFGCVDCVVTKGSGIGATEGLGIVGYQSSTGLPTVIFEGTALGSVDAPEPLQHLWGDWQLYSDAYTWVQPTTGQDATELAAILPNASTATPGLTTQLSANALQQRIPIIPGVLIEGVPDAGTGGVNELFNPIDGLPLTTDIEGSPRVYANGTRNIGAVQNIDAPTLGATPGDSEVILGWSPTPEGQALGYEICTSTTPLLDPLTGACPGTISPAGTSETSKTITGLTNGTPYYFAIQVISGIWSNVDTATPMGQLGIAQPTAVTAGDGSLQVDWNAPTDLGGYKGQLSYNVLYRPVGTQTWINGPQGITALTATLTGLTNGTTYDIGVLAQTTDGGLSPSLGTITGAPQAAPTLSYATPSAWPQHTPLTLTPSVGQLQGAGAYSIESGALPDGMSLNPSTGVISGTPTTQQSTSATIRLTDGSTNLFVEATVPLTIVAPSPSPQLWYPAIQTTVGVGPVSATPTQSNIPAGAIFSVVAGESLPGGFGINASTGVISGTPTSAPGQVVDVDIQACWGGCDPNAGEVRIAPMLFYILPGLQYPANTNATAGVAVTINPTVDLWSVGQFSISAGSLPAGMSLNTTTGVISGTPQTQLNTQLTVRYSTGVNVLDPPLEYVYSDTQINVAYPTITLTYPAVTAYVGKSLSVSPTVSGLTGTTVYSNTSSSLPQGLSLNPATGVISGVPTDTPGSYPVVIQVTDPYGSQRTSVVIDLKPSPSTVTTQAVTDIDKTTATGHGNISDLGSPTPTQHGVCWNTTGTPTTADSKTEEGSVSATGAFTSNITGLRPGTDYYVRAYATNRDGTSYGNEVFFISAGRLATGTPYSYKVTVTKVEMFNGTSWVTLFSGTAQLDMVPGGTFPGISDLSLPAGTYSQVRITFKNAFPVTGTLGHDGTSYYTTNVTFGGQTNLDSTPTTTAGDMAEFTFYEPAWGALNADVTQTSSITPITVGPSTDYQPTLRFTISTTFHLKESTGNTPGFYFSLGVPTVSLVGP